MQEPITSDKVTKRLESNIDKDQSMIHQPIVIISSIETTLLEKFPDHYIQVNAGSASTQLASKKNFSVCLIDGRGLELSLSNVPAIAHLFDVALTIVNTESSLPTDSQQTPTNLTLITESEFGSNSLDLRLQQALLSVKNSAKRTRRTAGIDTDIAESSIIKENAYEILTNLMSVSNDWIVIKDLDNRFSLVSNRFAQTYNKTISELIGKNDLELGTAPSLVLGTSENNWHGFWADDLDVVKSGEPIVKDHLLIGEDEESETRERSEKIPLKDKNGNVFALLVCVSETKKQIPKSPQHVQVSQNAWENKSNLQLSPVLRQMNEEHTRIQKLNDESQSAYKSKNDFIATSSHDLRQPLHALGMFIESLEKRLSKAEELKLLGKIKQSSQTLNSLLNGILDISRLDGDMVEPKKAHFNIANLLKSINDEFQPLASAKSLTLHTNISNTVVYTDSLLLNRILRNLVSYAIAHTTSGTVNITTEIHAHYLVVSVADTGPGIPENQIEAVFEEYCQLNNPEKEHSKGLGLGLAIVKRLARLLELDVTLESVVNEGSRFSAQVPLGDETALQPLVNNSLDTLHAPYRLLIVDDDTNVLEAMEGMLEDIDCEVYTATNISEALEIITELTNLPDILLVDYQLQKGETGVSAIEEICTLANKEIPAVIITGDTALENLRRADNSAMRVLNKPVSPDNLFKTVNSIMAEEKTKLQTQTD